VEVFNIKKKRPLECKSDWGGTLRLCVGSSLWKLSFTMGRSQKEIIRLRQEGQNFETDGRLHDFNNPNSSLKYTAGFVPLLKDDGRAHKRGDPEPAGNVQRGVQTERRGGENEKNNTQKDWVIIGGNIFLGFTY